MQIKIALGKPAEAGCTPTEATCFGQSKCWGSPDLPEGVEYPFYTDAEGDKSPYVFICQLNCADICTAFIAKSLLIPSFFPSEGLFYVFAKIDYYLGNYASEVSGEGVWTEDCVKVLYSPVSDPDLLASIILVDGEDAPVIISPRPIIFVAESAETSPHGGHELFGKPDLMPWAGCDASCEDWQVLLQVDMAELEPFVFRLVDEGIFYLLISSEDLVQGDFSKVRGAMC